MLGSGVYFGTSMCVCVCLKAVFLLVFQWVFVCERWCAFVSVCVRVIHVFLCEGSSHHVALLD